MWGGRLVAKDAIENYHIFDSTKEDSYCTFHQGFIPIFYCTC